MDAHQAEMIKVATLLVPLVGTHPDIPILIGHLRSVSILYVLRFPDDEHHETVMHNVFRITNGLAIPTELPPLIGGRNGLLGRIRQVLAAHLVKNL